jgi:hypothetical protein
MRSLKSLIIPPTRARENPANPPFFAPGDFINPPNPLIFLDSTIRQSTGFDLSASSNGIKSQGSDIRGALAKNQVPNFRGFCCMMPTS